MHDGMYDQRGYNPQYQDYDYYEDDEQVQVRKIKIGNKPQTLDIFFMSG